MFNSTRNLALMLSATLVVVILFFSRKEPAAMGMTAHGTEKKSLVTVPLESGLEAVVTLDHMTGDLSGYVLNRSSGQFFIRYRYNVEKQFPNHQGNYLVAAGLADFRGFQRNDRIANGVIYISEDNSQRVVAFGLPWNPNFATSDAAPQDLEFVALDQAQTRFTPVR